MKKTAILIALLGVLFSCKNNKESLILEKVAQKKSQEGYVGIIVNNPLNKNIKIASFEDFPQEFVITKEVDTLFFGIDKPTTFELTQGGVFGIGQKIIALPGDTITFEVSEVVNHQYKNRKIRKYDSLFYKLSSINSEKKFPDRKLLYEEFYNEKKADQNNDNKGYMMITSISTLKTASTVENRDRFRELFKQDLLIAKYKQELLDSLSKGNLISAEYVNYYNEEIEYELLSQAVLKHRKSADPHFEKYVLEKMNTLEDSNYYFIDNFLINFIQIYVLQNRITIENGQIVYNYLEAFSLLNEFVNSSLIDRAKFVCLKLIHENGGNLSTLMTELQTKDTLSFEFIMKVMNDKASPDMSKVLEENVLNLSDKGKNVIKLVDILDSHKGKFVYLDFWATWCPPCIESFEYSSKLQLKYQDDLTIIYISIDDSFSKWSRVSEYLDFTQNNFMAINAKRSDFVKKLNISFLPRYVLLDREGKIINANEEGPKYLLLNSKLENILN